LRQPEIDADFCYMMMVLSALRPDSSLAEFLAYRARSASVRRLAIDLVVGIAGVSAVLWWRPQYWLVLASISGCFLAYGSWGLLDRALPREATQSNGVLRVIVDTFRSLSGALGVLSAAALHYSVWAMALGTWIS
jgi:hypothetical protein